MLYDLFISYADFSDRQVFMTHIKFTKLTEDAGIQIPDLHLVLCRVKVLKFEEFLETSKALAKSVYPKLYGKSEKKAVKKLIQRKLSPLMDKLRMPKNWRKLP